jgi:hypothetical protein
MDGVMVIADDLCNLKLQAHLRMLDDALALEGVADQPTNSIGFVLYNLMVGILVATADGSLTH